ncbi:hypothetical protein CLOM_g14538 [Closterium sp. NIES-68]|nr:hypothetical protein CLOM_g14538 [Closterium sp. NIES-68]
MKVPIGLVEMEAPRSLIGQKTSVLIDRAPFKPTPATEALASLLLPASTRFLRALFLPAVYQLEIECWRPYLANLLDEPDATIVR